MLGWKFVHFRPAQTNRGWRTPVEGPLGAGWPDLVLLRERDQKLLFAELKSDTGRLTAAQSDCLATLTRAGAHAFLWRPRDFDTIAEVLA